MIDKLYQVVSKVMNIPITEITDNSGQENIESWDSFNVYVLLDEIESEFNVRFNLDETLEIRTVGDFNKLLKKHGIT